MKEKYLEMSQRNKTSCVFVLFYSFVKTTFLTELNIQIEDSAQNFFLIFWLVKFIYFLVN